MALVIENSDQFRHEISSKNVVLADFFADWCEPCKWLDLILQNVEKRLPEGCSIIKIDTEKYLDLCNDYGIKSVPVLIIFKNGTVVWRMNGFSMEEELLEILSNFSRET